MAAVAYNELIFGVIQDGDDGGFVAECLTECIVTQGNSWDELRANVLDAVDAFFFDAQKPHRICLCCDGDKVLMVTE